MRAIVAAATLLAVATSLSAQQAAPPRGWTWGIGGILMMWPNALSVGGNSAGAALHVAQVIPGGVGFDMRIEYLMPNDAGTRGASGLLGLSYFAAVGDGHLAQLKAGVTGVGIGSGASAGGAGGPYVGGGILFRLSRGVGIHVDALARFYAGEMTPSLGFALVALPGGDR